MFERYTEKARRVIFFARYEASQFGAPTALRPNISCSGFSGKTKRLQPFPAFHRFRSSTSTKGFAP